MCNIQCVITESACQHLLIWLQVTQPTCKKILNLPHVVALKDTRNLQFIFNCITIYHYIFYWMYGCIGWSIHLLTHLKNIAVCVRVSGTNCNNGFIQFYRWYGTQQLCSITNWYSTSIVFAHCKLQTNANRKINNQFNCMIRNYNYFVNE